MEEDARGVANALKQAAKQIGAAVYAELETFVQTIGTQSAEVKLAVKSSQESAVSSKQHAGEMVVSNLVYSGLVIAALLLAGWLIHRLVVRPIRNIVDAVEDLAEGEGDLTQRLRASGSAELSQLSFAFNHFLQRLDLMVSGLTRSVANLAPMAMELAQTNQGIKQSSEEQSAQTSLVSSHMQNTMGMAEAVANKVGEISEIADQSVGKLAQGKKVAHVTVDAMNALAEQIKASNDAVMMLKADSEKIESVIDVINAISEQTNLLALNAAIEAARAGEAGRGFAVVAEEVRSLASRTRESTLEVSSMVQSIQQNTNSVADAMQQGVSSTTSSIELVNNTAEAISEVGQLINEINAKAGEINTATGEQNASFASVSDSVRLIEDHTRQNAHKLQANFAVGEDLTNLSDKLQAMVSEFRVSGH